MSQESGDRSRETGERRRETGDRRKETGARKQETGGKRWATGKCSAYNLAGVLRTLIANRKLKLAVAAKSAKSSYR